VKRIEVKFNNSRQSIIFFIHHSLNRFRKKYKCDAWYSNHKGREPRSGVFGVIHLPKADRHYMNELVAHEVSHAVDDWSLYMRGSADAKEERRATVNGEIVRKFWKVYERNK